MVGFSLRVFLVSILWCYSSAQMMAEVQEVLMLRTAIDKIIEIKTQLQEQQTRSEALDESVTAFRNEINDLRNAVKESQIVMQDISGHQQRRSEAIEESVLNIRNDINDWRNSMKESQSTMETIVRDQQRQSEAIEESVVNIRNDINNQITTLQNCATMDQLENLQISVATEQNETRIVIEQCSKRDEVTETPALLPEGDDREVKATLKWTSNRTVATLHNLDNCREESTLATIACGKDSDYFDGLCYHISTQKGTWQEGKNYCSELPGYYAKISSPEEWAFVASRVTESTWIGLSDLERKGIFKWDRDSTYVFTNWHTNQPDNHSGKEHCIHYGKYTDSKAWNDWTCDKELKYLCERDEEQGECPTGYLKFNGSCYLISSDKKNWRDALNACRDMGAYYAKITSEAEDSFLQGHLKEHTWFGLSDLDRDGQYKWTKDGEVIFNKWGQGQPDNTGGVEDCAHLSKEMDYLVNDHQCHKQFNFLCTMEPTIRVV